MVNRYKEQKNNKKILKSFESLRKECNINTTKDIDKETLHRDAIIYAELLYMELSNVFHHLGYIHLDDNKENHKLHKRYTQKGIYYSAKHKRHMASAHLEGIYKDIKQLEDTSSMWKEVLEDADNTIENIDSIYNAVFIKE